ncbi:MAG: aminoglycoside 6-adenylyltransferase [Pseudooceanicola sp.]
MWQSEFADRVAARIADHPDLGALFLSGSLATGAADADSDVDFLAVTTAEDAAPLAEAWVAAVALEGEVILRFGRGSGNTLLVNLVLDDWRRADLHLVPRRALEGRAQDRLRPLIDPEGMHHALPERSAPAQPGAAMLAGRIQEFLRILGLVPVALNRREFVVAQQGHGMLRDMLIAQMKADAAAPPDTGMLHLRRDLPEADIAVLEALPLPRPDREGILDAQMAVAAVFLPRARRAAERLGVDWPDRFEAATRARLSSALGADLPPSG